MTLQLSPAAIVANGTSTSVATARVTDASGDSVAGDAVTFTFSDGRAQAAGHDNGDGTYTATITSSPTPEQVTITATDTSVSGVSAQAVLAQTTGPSTTSVQAVPAASVTNQVVALVATVSTNGSAAAISGSITFTNFGVPIGCSDEAVSTSSPTATCQVSFTALRSPEQITATFAPDANAGVAGSAGTLAFPVTSDSTATALHASVPSPAIGGTTLYTATVVARHPGFALPSGSVEFVDNAHVVSACAHQPLRLAGTSLTASCSVKYTTPGTHELVARYLGDRDFGSSASSVQRVRIPPLPKLSSRLKWSFRSTPTYTKVLTLVASRVPAGSRIVAICHGRGCPFAKRVIGLAKSSHKRTVDLTARFSDNRLSVNAQLTVEIVRANFIGRYFNFVVRSGRSPSVRISCLVPGAVKPGVGC
jgi:Invasin, domain 3/Bacterial Ig-like domain (group 3)